MGFVGVVSVATTHTPASSSPSSVPCRGTTTIRRLHVLSPTVAASATTNTSRMVPTRVPFVAGLAFGGGFLTRHAALVLFVTG